jgi:hypothetical protein
MGDPRLTQRQFRLARTIVVFVVVVIVASLFLTSGGGSGRTPGTVAHTASKVSTRSTAPTTTTTTVPPSTTTTTGPGSLPQTESFPVIDAGFQSEMAALWQGIITNSPAAALPAYFPEAAYLQLKTLPSDAADYQDRLIADYNLDIGAAHTLLGAGASGATLTSVNVPSQYGHWVPPGVCDNSIGYFEVANARIVYTEAGVTHSFGIASLISWRGVWYVVHLGAILRSGGGEVLDPADGPGYSADSSTC